MLDEFQRTKSAAHDAKGLLVRASLALEILEKNKSGDVRKQVVRVSRAIEQLAELCLREFSAEREWTRQLQRFDAQDVKVLLRQAVGVARMKSNLTETNAKFRVSADPDVVISADRLTLFRATYNLVINALHSVSNAKHATIFVSAHCDMEKVWIDVVDNGPGLSDDVLETLFPFAQATPNRCGPVEPNLTTASHLTKELGGELLLVQTGIEGTVFRMKLPAYIAAPAVEPAIQVANRGPVVCQSHPNPSH
ncbi:MAG: HAMP domain-containing sensor histidine kinase [Pseudomonadota bacterium]